MTTPVLYLLAGSNGSGKSTFAEILVTRTRLPFVNADLIAEQRWPGDRERQAREARTVSALATAERGRMLEAGLSFVTETVFSHESKLDLTRSAIAGGYTVHLHVMLVPVELAIARVADRVSFGGHHVPEAKIRSRYARLWELVAQARGLVDRADFYDNSRIDQPFRRAARYEHGELIGKPTWPAWTPSALLGT